LCVKLDADDSREHVEICPEAGVIAVEIANRIAKYHGFALIADYGHTGEKTDTFRVPCCHGIIICVILCYFYRSAEFDFRQITYFLPDLVSSIVQWNLVTELQPVSSELFITHMCMDQAARRPGSP